MTAAPDAIFTFARRHDATEQDIGPGVAFTFLRGSYFIMRVLRLIIGDDGVIRIGNLSSYLAAALPTELRCYCGSGIMTLTAGRPKPH